jgi:nicotinate (nicotinamide) nucleotide adenylyltransferase
MASNNRLNTVLFGGSFDPPTEGHWQVADALSFRLVNMVLTKYRQFDEIWFLPSSSDPLGKKKLIPFYHRVDMLRCMINEKLNKNKYKICTIEKDLPQGIGTLAVIDALNIMYPGRRFWLFIGADELLEIKYWKRSYKLRRQVPFIVVDRAGILKYCPSLIRLLRNDVINIGAEESFASSTKVRNDLAKKRDFYKDVRHRHLSKSVQEYIYCNHLYKE